MCAGLPAQKMIHKAKIRSASAVGRTNAIVAAACRAFLEQGYDGTTMDLVAAEANVTKKTIYNHFPSKEALFEAVAASFCDKISSSVNLDSARNADVASSLKSFCHSLIGTLALPPGMDIYRLAIAQCRRFPEFGQNLISIGVARIEAPLVAFLNSKSAEEKLSFEDARLAARHLLGELTIVTHRALLGQEIPLQSSSLDRYVSDVVVRFCKTYAPRPERSQA